MSGWRKKRGIMKRYDATAEIYDKRYAEEQTAKIEAALKHLTIKQDDKIIDSGCGTGILFDYLGKARLIVGTDISKKTLAKAVQHVQGDQLSKVHLIQADMDNMPFADHIFNKVFLMTVLQNSPKHDRTLAETKRIGTNKGAFVITGLKRIFNKRLFQELLRKGQFKILTLEEEDLKCYVAICANSPVNSSTDVKTQYACKTESLRDTNRNKQ